MSVPDSYLTKHFFFWSQLYEQFRCGVRVCIFLNIFNVCILIMHIMYIFFANLEIKVILFFKELMYFQKPDNFMEKRLSFYCLTLCHQDHNSVQFTFCDSGIYLILFWTSSMEFFSDLFSRFFYHLFCLYSYFKLLLIYYLLQSSTYCLFSFFKEMLNTIYTYILFLIIGLLNYVCFMV